MKLYYPLVLIGLLSVLLGAAQAQQAGATAGQSQSNIGTKALPAVSQPASMEEMPVTVHPAGTSSKAADTDPVLGVPPLPKGKTSLIGGRVSHIDKVRNRLSVKIFGGGKWNMLFDERTHFFRDGVATTFEHINKGDRVYVDTMLDPARHQILARNVRIVTRTGPADARGQVESIGDGVMKINDLLSSQPVRFEVTNSTQVTRNGQRVSLSDVQPGSLIAVKFAPGKAERGVAQNVELLAAPGDNFVFAGKVMHLDLSQGTLAVQNRTDHQTYDIAFDRHGSVPQNLTLGSQVKVAAVFDGTGYKANSINVESSQ